MTNEEMEQLFNEISEENVDKLIQFYIQYIDKKFMEESKKGAYRTLSYMKKHYSLMINIQKGLLDILIYSKQKINDTESLFNTIK